MPGGFTVANFFTLCILCIHAFVQSLDEHLKTRIKCMRKKKVLSLNHHMSRENNKKEITLNKTNCGKWSENRMPRVSVEFEINREKMRGKSINNTTHALFTKWKSQNGCFTLWAWCFSSASFMSRIYRCEMFGFLIAFLCSGKNIGQYVSTAERCNITRDSTANHCYDVTQRAFSLTHTHTH